MKAKIIALILSFFAIIVLFIVSYTRQNLDLLQICLASLGVFILVVAMFFNSIFNEDKRYKNKQFEKLND